MIAKTLADGTRVYFQMCDRCGGPDSGSGQRWGTSYLYYKVDDGPWEHSEHRNMLRAIEWLELCECKADFLAGETLT